MAEKQLNILCFGAHPDDCDLRFGGTAMKYRALGHRVGFVSMTNGDGGHFSMGGGPLAKRRHAEAQAAAKVAGIHYELLDIHDGELAPSIELRNHVIRMIREFHADLVLCHRPNDYHPDHQAVGVLVQHAAYLVTVPNVAALTPHIERAPVVGYFFDTFTVPTPYVPTIAIDTDDVFDRKVNMVHQHESQMYEWLPYNRGALDSVPKNEAERKAWLRDLLKKRFAGVANAARETLLRYYGEKKGRTIQTAETVSVSEYGHTPSEQELLELFPFFGD